MKLKYLLLILLISSAQNIFAQGKNYEKSLSVAFNILYNELPNDYCKSLYGTLQPNTTSTYNAKVKLPLSVDNRFEVDKKSKNPLIFMSYVGAGKDVKKAAAQLKKIGNTIEAIAIKYKGQDYKIKYSTELSKDGERPDFKYKLVNPPTELKDALIYIRLDETYLDGNKAYVEKNKWQFTMGLFVDLSK